MRIHNKRGVVRRGIALCILLLFSLEGSGLARVLHRVAMVSCCCGEHRAARPCRCKSCPVIKHRRAVDDGDCLHQEPPCGGDDERAISSMVFVLPAAAPLAAPAFAGRAWALVRPPGPDFAPPPAPPPPERLAPR
jgi:hypothetical protein